MKPFRKRKTNRKSSKRIKRKTKRRHLKGGKGVDPDADPDVSPIRVIVKRMVHVEGKRDIVYDSKYDEGRQLLTLGGVVITILRKTSSNNFKLFVKERDMYEVVHNNCWKSSVKDEDSNVELKAFEKLMEKIDGEDTITFYYDPNYEGKCD
jgi:hypothetical protein